ncbi:MAG: FAD-dependent oxidoreductase [Chloroflexi bacterium]|nr:FAD-dependent oxidoreductase [Chloroflexota bacterium]
MKTHVQVVVIGGGVIGCSILYHLTKLGWHDVVLLEKAELSSGSTWHAAGGFHALNGDTNLSALQGYTVELFQEIERVSDQSISLHQAGNLYLAATKDRLDFLKGEHGKARYTGISSEMISVDEAHQICPILNPAGLVGAMYDPHDGHIDPSGVTQALAKSAMLAGAEIYRYTPVENTIQNDDGSWRVVTAKGEIRANYIVNAAGLWGRELAAMVGLQLPIIPMEHQYIVTDVIPEVDALEREIPMVIDFQGESYLRQEGGALLIGTYEKDCRHWALDGTPQDFTNQLLEPDLDRLMDRMEVAFNRYPCLARAGVQTIVNGPMVFAPDGNPTIGPVPGLPNYFLAVGIMAGFSQGAGVGTAVSEWIVNGEPSKDVFAMDITRFGEYALGQYTLDKTYENYGRRFAITYPNEELLAGRPLLTTPSYEQLKKAGAVYGASFGLEYPLWFAPKGMEPIETPTFHRSNAFQPVGAECRAVRSSAGLLEIANYAKYEVSGSGAGTWLNQVLANRVPKKGRIALAPMLSPKGRLIGDFTVAHVDDERFVLVGSGSAIAYHMRWFKQHLPPNGVTLRHMSYEWPGFSIAGPNSNHILASITDEDVSPSNFRFLDIREMQFGTIPAIVARISFTGELGYEIYAPREHHVALYEMLREAGRPFQMCLFGSRALDSLRLEKGFGGWGREYTPDYNPYEAGLGQFVNLNKGNFIGRETAITLSQQVTAKKRCTLIVEVEETDPIADEPVFHNGEVVGFVTSGGYGHLVQKSIALAYVPTELAVEGTQFEVEILGYLRPAILVADTLHDPTGARMRVR